MFRKLTCVFTAIAFTSCVSFASFAQDNRFISGDPYADKARMQAGVYLKIPFTGGLKSYKREKLKFGASLGFTREYRTSNSMFALRKQFTANLLDMKFDNKGFKALSLSGRDIFVPQNGGIIFAIEDDEKSSGGSKIRAYLLIGGAFIATVGLLTLICSKRNDGCQGSLDTTYDYY